MSFSDYVVFIDESGDHGMAAINPQFPVFTLACCIFRKDRYVDEFIPAMQRFKFHWFGHGSIVLHGSEIRKSAGRFRMLLDPTQRGPFLAGLAKVVADAPATIVAAVIRKSEFHPTRRQAANPYVIGLKFCLERIHGFLRDQGDPFRVTHCLVERRGRREDRELTGEFEAIARGANRWGALPFELVPVEKACNSSGLQLADLVAHPISRHVMNPAQPNRAYDLVTAKFRTNPAGDNKGWGLKIYP